MEVILIENIDKLGSRGQLVKVADGYGRNYLLPKKLAVAATPENRKWVEQQRVRFLKLEAKEKADASDLATLLDGVSATIIRKAGDKGNLFGSVTSLDIAEKLLAQGYHIDKRKIHLPTPIKVLGEYSVPVKLHREVTTTIKVLVEPDEETKAKLQAAAEAQVKAAAAPPAMPKEAPPADVPAPAPDAEESN
ncbi:MAG TPA: 50S ribosomal protein L9 [Terriglobia bacterium]|nr:50S ribosomal protein L9 [Terriglobia bacterium]